MMKIRSGFLSRRILFSKNNGYLFITRCFSIKTLNIHNVQDGNVNILAVVAFQATYFPRYLLLYCSNLGFFGMVIAFARPIVKLQPREMALYICRIS